MFITGDVIYLQLVSTITQRLREAGGTSNYSNIMCMYQKGGEGRRRKATTASGNVDVKVSYNHSSICTQTEMQTKHKARGRSNE